MFSMGPGELRDLPIRTPSAQGNPASQAMQHLPRTPNSTTPRGNRQQDFDRQARNSHNLPDTCSMGQGIWECCTAFPLQKAFSAPTLLLPSPPRQAVSPKVTVTSETPGRPGTMPLPIHRGCSVGTQQAREHTQAGCSPR